MLSFMEQLLLMYRTLLTIPCWLLFYEGIGMGALLTSSMRGELPVSLSCAHRSDHASMPCHHTAEHIICVWMYGCADGAPWLQCYTCGSRSGIWRWRRRQRGPLQRLW